MPSTRYLTCSVPTAVPVCAMIPPFSCPPSSRSALLASPSPAANPVVLAGPETELDAPGDELGRGGVVEADEAVVHQAAEPGRLEQRRGARVPDELAVRVGVGHE